MAHPHGCHSVSDACEAYLQLSVLAAFVDLVFDDLECSQELATLEVLECNLPAEVPQALAAHLPRNLQTLQLRYVTRMWYTEEYEARG